MWNLFKNEYDIDKQMLEESLFTIGNGYLGVRGCFEEGYPQGESVRGTYINGIYDRVSMVHAEMAYGFPVIQDKQPRILDTQTCEVWLDGERAQLVSGNYNGYKRFLDMKNGEAVRSYIFKTSSGKSADLKFRRLASLSRFNLLAYQISVTYDGDIRLISVCDTDIENYSNPNDPRTGQGHTRLMSLEWLEEKNNIIYALMKTKTTNIEQLTTISHNITSNNCYEIAHWKDDGKYYTQIDSRDSIILEKYVIFMDGLRFQNLKEQMSKQLNELVKLNYQSLLAEQREALDSYWEKSCIEIEGNEHDQNAIRFMQFQLIQSTGVDEFSNVAAKGLSGEGYEGHYFWDTEIYIIPMLLLNQPERAKTLLSYRARILPDAKKRALELGHTKGAAYPWRTISGIECSGYFPAGTAQYHINSDIAHAFIQYYIYTEDICLMLNGGFEVIIETARTWLEIGHFHENKFMIHDVTGPDEYTAIVNNNYYTNAMAKYHLIWAYKLYSLMTSDAELSNKEEVLKLLRRLDFSEEEALLMKKASDFMYLPYDEKYKMHAQDDSFLSKPIWPFENDIFKKRPLLLHYHPLAIYRHQVLKQADTVLAHMLLEEYADEESIKNAFDYYERITTHDSSLSSCIYGIMASRCGYKSKSYHYFKESIDLDLEDTHGNTKDGLHMANIAGTLLSVTAGFAGVRVIGERLILRPQLPSSWKSYAFNIEFKGRTLRIEIGEQTQVIRLAGKPIEILINDEVVVC